VGARTRPNSRGPRPTRRSARSVCQDELISVVGLVLIVWGAAGGYATTNPRPPAAHSRIHQKVANRSCAKDGPAAVCGWERAHTPPPARGRMTDQFQNDFPLKAIRPGNIGTVGAIKVIFTINRCLRVSLTPDPTNNSPRTSPRPQRPAPFSRAPTSARPRAAVRALRTWARP